MRVRGAPSPALQEKEQAYVRLSSVEKPCPLTVTGYPPTACPVVGESDDIDEDDCACEHSRIPRKCSTKIAIASVYVCTPALVRMLLRRSPILLPRLDEQAGYDLKVVEPGSSPGSFLVSIL